MWIEAQVTVSLAFVRFENLLVGSAAVLSKQLGLMFRAESLLLKDAVATKAGQTCYRSMTKEAPEMFLSPGKMPAATGTFVSPTSFICTKL